MNKTYNRTRYREKFHRYRVFFALTVIVFLAACIAEIVLYGNLNFSYQWQKSDFLAFFSELFAGELLVFLALFLFGVTLYAPAFGFLCAAARGAFSGFCLSVLFAELEGKSSVLLFILTLLYLILSAWLFLSFASFCTTTALQIFSAPEKKAEGEKQMYGGTLFYSSFTQGSINWRFLASYLLIFLASVFFLFVLTALFSALRSLV